MYMSETSKKKYEELKDILKSMHSDTAKYNGKENLIRLIDSIIDDDTEDLKESLDTLHYIITTLVQATSVSADTVEMAHKSLKVLEENAKEGSLKIAELEKQIIDLSGGELNIH